MPDHKIIKSLLFVIQQLIGNRLPEKSRNNGNSWIAYLHIVCIKKDSHTWLSNCDRLQDYTEFSIENIPFTSTWKDHYFTTYLIKTSQTFTSLMHSSRSRYMMDRGPDSMQLWTNTKIINSWFFLGITSNSALFLYTSI